MKSKNWAKILGLAAILIAGAAFAMSDLYVSGTWRYRITVEIETSEGIKTGSAVHQLSNSTSSVKTLDLPEAGNPPEFKGEAVAIDLGSRGIVFAILPTDPYYMFQHTFYGDRGGATTTEGIKFFNALKGGDRRELSPKDYPWFVMFKNIDDPKSVTLVKGGEFNVDKQEYVPVDYFEKIFGEGVKFKNITLEITDEPVTRGIEGKLKWLPALKGSYLHGGSTSRGAPLGLHVGHFKKGE
jgi:hypothetical protein